MHLKQAVTSFWSLPLTKTCVGKNSKPKESLEVVYDDGLMKSYMTTAAAVEVPNWNRSRGTQRCTYADQDGLGCHSGSTMADVGT